MKNLTIAQKLMICIGLSMVLIVGATTIVQYRLFSGLVTERVTDSELPATLQGIRNDINTVLARSLTTAQRIAGNRYLKQWLAAGEPEAERDTATAYFRDIQRSTGAEEVYYASAKTSNYYGPKGLERTIKRADSWFYELVRGEGDKPYRYNVNTEDGTLQVFTNHAIVLDGERVGVTGIGFTLTEMAKTVRDYQVGDSGFVFLASRDGSIAIHPRGSELAGESVKSLPGIGTAAAELLAAEGYRSTTATAADGTEYLVAALDVPQANWVAFAQVPRAEIFADINNALSIVTALAVAVVIASLAVIWYLLRALLRPIRRTAAAMQEIAEGDGDLTQRLPDEGRDEMSELARQFNAFVEKVQGAIQRVGESTDQLASAGEELTRVASQTRDGVQRQGGETDQIASAINEMTATVQEISRNGSEVETAASEADRYAQDGGQVIQETIQSIESLAGEIEGTESAVNALAERTQEIETVLDVIRDVTEQTNLLALNAAIEAARAGEQGRGFAVVAEEVRALAKRSSESAERIREMIDKLVADTQGAVERMGRSRSRSDETMGYAGQAGDALQTIQQAVTRIHDQVTQIATAAEEQGQVAEEINRNVTGIVEISHNSSESMQQTETASGELARLGERLRAMVSQFKV